MQGETPLLPAFILAASRFNIAAVIAAYRSERVAFDRGAARAIRETQIHSPVRTEWKKRGECVSRRVLASFARRVSR